MLLLYLLLLPFYFDAKAEVITTSNLINEADTWDQTGLVSSDTCSYSGTLEPGEVCFGHALTNGEIDGGGIITSNQMSLINDAGMSVGQLNQGFTFNYGFDAESHISNINIPTCSETTGDCKDIIDLTLTLTETNGTIINTYNHYIELNYSGLQTYDYTNTIGANNYSDVLSQLQIFGVDAGFTNGYYGAIIDDPYFTVTYDTFVLIDSIIDIIEAEIIDVVIDDILITDDIVQIEIDLPDIFDEPIELDFNITTDFEPIEIDAIQEIEVIEIQMTEAVEVEIVEVQMEIAELFEEIEIEEIPEPETVEEEPETTEPEPETETVEDQSPGDDASGDEQEEEVVEEQTNEDEKETETTEVLVADKKAELKQKIANKLMEKTTDKNSVAANTQVLGLMVALTDTAGFTEYQTATITETSTWYDSKDIYMDQTILQDPFADVFAATQNYQMNMMENSQY
jgi:hypothetical protein